MVVTDQSFADEVLGSSKPVLVDFWANWCGPCKQVAPVLEEIASEHNEITIAKMDIDVNPQTPRKYKIMSIPTMILFSGGKPVKQIVGAKSKAALLVDLAAYLD
jgi:thioredoxin 1